MSLFFFQDHQPEKVLILFVSSKIVTLKGKFRDCRVGRWLFSLEEAMISCGVSGILAPSNFPAFLCVLESFTRIAIAILLMINEPRSGGCGPSPQGG